MKLRNILWALALAVPSLPLMAQTDPAAVVGNVKNWSGYGTAAFGQAQGFTCNITVQEANFKNTDNISQDGETFTTRVKVMNGESVELPELTGLGTVSFYIMGGAGATVHPNGTTRDYALLVERLVNGSWVQAATIGADCPKAATMKRYDVTLNQSSAVKLRLRNTDQSVWLSGIAVTAPAGASSGTGNGWQSKLVSMDSNGFLTYNTDEYGFRLPDWGQCGYKNAREAVPDVQVSGDRLVTVTAVSGDNTANIQNAINRVGALEKNADGIRGVVLLKAGLYTLDNTVYVNKDGVILRGEGNAFNRGDENQRTRLYRRNSADVALNVVVLGTTNNGSNWWGNNISNRQNITTQKVMPGDWSFEVADASGFSVGDALYIKYPLTEAWLAAVKYGGNTNGVNWTTSFDLNMCYYRYIERIEGNRIYLDAPMFYAMDRALSQPFVGKLNTSGKIIRQVALENMDIYVDRAPTSSTNKPQQHCVNMSNCENSWMKDVSARNFVHSGFHFQSTTRSTVQDCYSVDPSGLVDGGNYYNFDVYECTQLLLIKDCYARNGRHNFVSNGCASVSGIAVQNFQSANPKTCSEGHRYWSQGILFDNWVETTGAPWDGLGLIGMYLRNNMGTAHGWGGTQSVCWNCDVKNGDILLDKVPTGQNYAIGCQGRQVHKYLSSNGNYQTGYVEGFNQTGIEPASLYEAQRRDYALRTGGSYEVPMSGVWIIGADGSVGKPGYTTGYGWSRDNAIQLTKESDNVYSTTLTVGRSLNPSQVNFKFFPNLTTWESVGFTGTEGSYHYTTDSPLFAIGDGTGDHHDGNIYLKAGQTLTDGDLYVFRIDCTQGPENAVLTIERKELDGIWLIGADGSVGNPYTSGYGWTESNAMPLTKVADRVFSISLKVGEQLNASQVNFKFFPQAGWGDDFLGTDNDYHLTSDSPLLGVGDGSDGHDNGNIYLKSGQTLEEGDLLTITIDCTKGYGQGVLTAALSKPVPSGIARPETLSTEQPPRYTLQGIRTDQPQRGIYIQQGRKHIAR